MSARKPTNRLRIFFHNVRYFCHRFFSYDHEQACRYMLGVGKHIAKPQPSEWDTCPVCGHELERTVQQGFIIPFCPKWHLHPPQDTNEQFTDVERQSDKLPVAVLNLPPGEWSRRWNNSDKHTQQVQVPPKS